MSTKKTFSRKGGWSTHNTSSYRSGLEDNIVQQLKKGGVPFDYEKYKINYVVPVSNHHYTPDFILQNGIIIEAKGLFEVADRTKHLLIKNQYPNLEIRFVFSNPNQKINKKSKTSYADWCTKHGFKYSSKIIPLEWLQDTHKYELKGVISKK